MGLVCVRRALYTVSGHYTRSKDQQSSSVVRDLSALGGGQMSILGELDGVDGWLYARRDSVWDPCSVLQIDSVVSYTADATAFRVHVWELCRLVIDRWAYAAVTSSGILAVCQFGQ